MDKDRYLLLVHKRLTETLSKAEENELQNWLQSSDSNEFEVNEIEKIWNLSEQYNEDYQPNVESGLAAFKVRIKEEEIFSSSNESTLKVRYRSRRWLQIAAAIVFLLGITAVLNVYFDQAEVIVVESLNGKKELQLPDGTKVLLNEDSKLTYPSDLNNATTRSIQLVGEAYFDVAHQEDQPFIISTESAEVQVLGTAFNLRAYPGEGFSEVEVSRGKVALRPKDDNREIILVAEEKGIWDNKSGLSKQKSPELNAQSWFTNALHFRKTKLKEVVNVLERHYDIKMDWETASVADCPFTFDFENEALDNVIKILKLSFQLDIEENEGIYKLKGGACGN